MRTSRPGRSALNKQSSSSMATAYYDSHARIQAHRRAHPKQPPKRAGLHDSTPPTHKTTITGTQRPAISSIHTHTQSRGRIQSAAAAQITAHSQRDDGNDDDDDHGKGPAAIKLLFQLHPLDGRPINPYNHQRRTTPVGKIDNKKIRRHKVLLDRPGPLFAAAYD